MNLEEYPEVKEAMERHTVNVDNLNKFIEERGDEELINLIKKYSESQEEIIGHILSKVMSDDLLRKAKGDKA